MRRSKALRMAALAAAAVLLLSGAALAWEADDEVGRPGMLLAGMSGFGSLSEESVLGDACADAVRASEPLPNTELTDSAAKMEHNHEHLEGEQARDPFCITHPDTDWRVCIAHAEKIGLGTSEYELIEVK